MPPTSFCFYSHFHNIMKRFFVAAAVAGAVVAATACTQCDQVGRFCNCFCRRFTTAQHNCNQTLTIFKNEYITLNTIHIYQIFNLT